MATENILHKGFHLIAHSKAYYQLADTMLDLKKFTSKKIEEAIRQNGFESRRDWMLWMFKRAGEKNSNNRYLQFRQQDNHPIELYGYEINNQLRLPGRRFQFSHRRQYLFVSGKRSAATQTKNSTNTG